MTVTSPGQSYVSLCKPEVAEIIYGFEVLLENLKRKVQGQQELQSEVLEDSVFAFSARKNDMPEDEFSKTLRKNKPSLPDPRLVKLIINSRNKRNSMFGGGLFGDPAWDMILDLVVAQAEFRRVSVTSLCIASGVPSTTALRRITQLVERGVFVRTEDHCDKRRVFITLSDSALRDIAGYFAANKVVEG